MRSLIFASKIGLLFGVLAGLSLGFRNAYAHGYLQNGLHNLAAKTIVRDMDILVGLGLVAGIVLVLMAEVITHIPGKTRVSLLCVLGLSGFAWLYCFSEVATAASTDVSAADSSFLQYLLSTSYAWSLVASCVLVMGTIYWLLFGRRATIRQANSRKVQSLCLLLVRLLHSSAGIVTRPWLSRYAIVLLLIVNMTALGLHLDARASVGSRPNVIIIAIDTLRADHVGCYGCTYGLTPRIDLFAKEATRFDQVVAQAPFTMWSVASYFSSRQPQSLVLNKAMKVATMAEFLQDKGFATAAVIGNEMLCFSDFYPKGFESYDISPIAAPTNSDLITKQAMSWIDRNKQGPFFLYLHFNDPHTPYMEHEGFGIGHATPTPESRGQSTEYDGMPKLKYDQANYCSEIAWTDHNIGLLFDELKDKGIYDSSIIVLVADHGEEFREHGGTFHGETLYREVLQVPLIVRTPRQTKARTVTGIMPLVYLFPTIVSNLGYDYPHLQTRTKAIDLHDDTKTPDTYIFSATDSTGRSMLRSIQYGRWKLIHELGISKSMLFDLYSDPFEKEDIVDGKPAVVAGMLGILRKNENSIGVKGSGAQTGIPTRKLDEQQKERIRALGYVNF